MNDDRSGLTRETNPRPDEDNELSALTRRLRTEIPLLQTMGVRLTGASANQWQLFVPLAPNINHLGTAFAGSQYALSAAGGWGLLQTRLEAHKINAHIVLYDGNIRYRRPIKKDFRVICAFSPEAFTAMIDNYLERGRGRLRLEAFLDGEGEAAAAHFTGDYAIRR